MMEDVALQAEVVRTRGAEDDWIESYLARPLGSGSHPGLVILHHSRGWDHSSKEIARTFANRGYIAIEPHLYHREGHGVSIEQAAERAREAGTPSDDRMLGDTAGAMDFIRTISSWNGRIAVVGYCSGGRQAYIAAARLPIDAAVACYGRRIVESPGDVTELRPVPPLDFTPDIACPVLGIFGAEDDNPSPMHREEIAATLDRHGKSYEFHSYDGAGHAFFDVGRNSYHPSAAKEAWARVFDFLSAQLGAPSAPLVAR
jgi:carboxymethylenebutenolidase